MQFDQALAYLLSLGHETLTIKLGLENTETLLKALGNPERRFPAVQIAGTNGKGSTAAFLDSICRAAGLRTGLFTSPHLVSITERIKVGGKQITEIQFARSTAMVKAAAEQLVAQGRLQTLPTFFEQITAIGLLAFTRARVELAILETGLGGRLDSTTAARAPVVAITPVDMDHQEYLGHTLAEIAAEKAAIIQPGVFAIVAPQKPAAFDVIIRRCEAVGVQPRIVISGSADANSVIAKPACVSRVFGATADGRAIVSFETPKATFEKLTLALRGRHQIANAATAIAIAQSLRGKHLKISNEAIARGLETAVHPGRLEMWPGKPQFLFDGAHNPAAARALRDYLEEFMTGPVVMIFGAMRDKDLSDMMATLFPPAATVILTTLDNPRAASIDELMAAIPAGLGQTRVVAIPTVAEALETARRLAAREGTVCITGSLHLIGKTQELLKGT